METAKAHSRRFAEGFFSRYVRDPGIDIGSRDDPLTPTFRKWDYHFGDTDATYMAGVLDESYTTVYASHVLEHILDVQTALKNWWRILKPGGHLIVVVPHRDLFECRTELPSQWNGEHKWFFLPNELYPPVTRSFAHLLLECGGAMVSFRVLDAGYHRDGDKHPEGEYSIEGILRK